jgi:hypothetical protein
MSNPTPQSAIEKLTPNPADLACVAFMLAKLKAGHDLRQAKVRRVREAILANDYENSLKLDVAADRVVDEIKPALPCPVRPGSY